MKWFFEDKQRIERLIVDAESWVGTPFRENARARGKAGGVDCQHLCEELLITSGVINVLDLPHIPLDYSMHNERSVVLDYLRGKLKDPQSAVLATIFTELSRAVHLIIPGDLLTFKIGKSEHHLGIALDNHHFVHCLAGPGVGINTLHDHTYGSRVSPTFFRACSLE